MVTGVHDKRVGSQNRFHFIEQEGPLLALCKQARCRSVQRGEGAFDLRSQSRDPGLMRSDFSTGAGVASGPCLDPSHGNPGEDQFMDDSRGERH